MVAVRWRERRRSRPHPSIRRPNDDPTLRGTTQPAPTTQPNPKSTILLLGPRAAQPAATSSDHSRVRNKGCNLVKRRLAAAGTASRDLGGCCPGRPHPSLRSESPNKAQPLLARSLCCARGCRRIPRLGAEPCRWHHLIRLYLTPRPSIWWLALGAEPGARARDRTPCHMHMHI